MDVKHRGPSKGCVTAAEGWGSLLALTATLAALSLGEWGRRRRRRAAR